MSCLLYTSPEWQALQAARRIQAQTYFIDLPCWAQSEEEDDSPDTQEEIQTLLPVSYTHLRTRQGHAQRGGHGGRGDGGRRPRRLARLLCAIRRHGPRFPASAASEGPAMRALPHVGGLIPRIVPFA